jgi:hypothetical protein
MNMSELIEKFSKIPNLKNPILVEGFPGVGNVGRIVVDFLIGKLKPKLYLRMSSRYFPNSVFVNEEHIVELPKTEFYYYKNKKGRDIVFVVGDVQPAEGYHSYRFCEEILDIAKSMKIKEVITLGGITSRVAVQNPVVYGACNDNKYIKPLQKCGVKFDRQGAIVIVGAAGLLLGLGKLKNMTGFALLAETSVEPNSIGFEAAKAILRSLFSYLNIKMSLTDIDKEIKAMTTGSKPMMQMKKGIGKAQMSQAKGPRDLRYIG